MTDPNNEIVESVDSNQETNSQPQEQNKVDVVTDDNAPKEEVIPGSNAQASNLVDKRKNKKRKPRGNQKKDGSRSETVSKSTSRGFQLTPDGLLRHFLACRVCCYFLSGVQVLYGREVVNRMVKEFDGSWLYVPLTQEVRTLMHKTYGVQVDEGSFFVEHACEVCCRRFVIDLPEPEDFVAPDGVNEPNLEEPERREPVIFEQPRTRQEREPDWGRDRPMLRVEFKHRR